MGHDYKNLRFTAGDLKDGQYKGHLGGGGEQWERRGEFQLELLRHLGLSEDNEILDVGCGPVRAGTHLMKFLHPGHYWGVDFNPSFIEAAGHIVEDTRLQARRPSISLLADFDFASLQKTFDYILCFSVLNHCSQDEHRLFIERVPHVMNGYTRLVISHARWHSRAHLADTRLKLLRAFRKESDLPRHLRYMHWGYKQAGDRLPILEFGLSG